MQKRRQHLFFKCAVKIDVDVPMRTGLATDQSIDAPAPFEPEPATEGAKDVHHREHLFERHSCGTVHTVIVTGHTA